MANEFEICMIGELSYFLGLQIKQMKNGTLVTILVRSGLDTMTPNQVLGDIMTDDTYRDEDEKKEKKKKDEKKMRRRRVWHSRPHHPRAKLSKKHQVRKMNHGMMMMMKRWLYLSRDLVSLW